MSCHAVQPAQHAHFASVNNAAPGAGDGDLVTTEAVLAAQAEADEAVSALSWRRH
jgi:hypothetical protein